MSRAPAALLAACLLLLAACGRPAEEGEVPAAATAEAGPPSIVLVSIDTLRSDRLPIYGYAEVETPALDALRADGLLFERAYSHAPLTLPSHVSLLTGLLPTRHRVRDNQGYRFEAEGVPYLPRLLAERGYATGAFVSAYVLRPETGLDAGFERYDGRFEAGEGLTFGDVARPGGETLDAALAWLDGVGERPFFLFLHLFEPHAPYAPPEPFASRYADPYDGEIAAADAVVGSLLEELRRRGLYEEAAVVLLSDHGEGLGDHGEQEHGVFLYREVLQVPLVVKLPGGARAGEAVVEPAQLVDVFPTLLELAGARPPEGLAGRSLLELGAAGGPARQIYAETFYPRLHYGWSELASLIEGRFHYLHGPAPELYDLVADPAERDDVLRRERRVYASLRDAMEGYDRSFDAPAAASAEERRKLAALGYLGGVGATSGPLPDPKRQYPTLADFTAALGHYRAEAWGPAVAGLEKVVSANPGMVDAWEYLAHARARLGRLDDARDAFRRALELSGGDAELALAAAGVSARLGRFEEARELLAVARSAAAEKGGVEAAEVAEMERRLARALAAAGRPREAVEVLAPAVAGGDAAAVLVSAEVRAAAGDAAGAQALLEALLAREAENAAAHEALGLVALGDGRFADAEAASRRAVELDPERVEAWNNLGVALSFLARPEQALEAWQRAVTLDPEAWDVYYNLGLKASEMGRAEDARRALESFVAGAPPERYGDDLRRARSLLRALGSEAGR